MRDFHLPRRRGREGLASRCLTVVGPRGQQGFVRPSPTRSLPEAPTVPGASGPAERASPAETASSLRTRPERRASAQAHFRKSLSSRHPQPDPHAAVTRDSGRLRGALVPRGEMHFTDRAFTVKAPEPGLGTGLSFPPEKGARGAGLSRGAGRGLTRIPAPEPPPAPHPIPPPAAPAPRCAPHPGPPGRHWGRAAAGRRHFASPRAVSHSPWAFTFSPRPCRLLRRSAAAGARGRG